MGRFVGYFRFASWVFTLLTVLAALVGAFKLWLIIFPSQAIIAELNALAIPGLIPDLYLLAQGAMAVLIILQIAHTLFIMFLLYTASMACGLFARLATMGSIVTYNEYRKLEKNGQRQVRQA
ncbi:MAG: hypothetical protein HZC41_25020 [Chloroflexi bacterium]|nr:hypothetical protein [Chloroflexota bacterium]